MIQINVYQTYEHRKYCLQLLRLPIVLHENWTEPLCNYCGSLTSLMLQMETKAYCTELLACLSCLCEGHKLFDIKYKQD